MKIQGATRYALFGLVALALVTPTLSVVATHNPGSPANRSANAGAMQCDTNQLPPHRVGQTPPPTGRTQYVVFNQDQGHQRLIASASAIGLVGCTFAIQVTGTTCTGTNPSCTLTNVVETPCSTRLGTCTATAEYDWAFVFCDPCLPPAGTPPSVPPVIPVYRTTHQYVYYDLVVWTGMPPAHVNPVVVASGVIDYYEPPNPTPVPIDGIDVPTL